MTNIKRDPAVSLAASHVRIRAHFVLSASRSAASGANSAQHTASLWIHVLSAALNTATSTLVPIAKLHPVRLVVCAAAVGAAIVWIRPWRWVTATMAAASLAVVGNLLTQAQSKNDAWSVFMDFLLQKKGPSQP